MGSRIVDVELIALSGRKDRECMVAYRITRRSKPDSRLEILGQYCRLVSLDVLVHLHSAQMLDLMKEVQWFQEDGGMQRRQKGGKASY